MTSPRSSDGSESSDAQLCVPADVFALRANTPLNTALGAADNDWARSGKREGIMVQRYAALGAMSQSDSGSYVAVSDYEKLHMALTHILQVTSTCFKQIEVGEMTATDGQAALKVCAELALS